MVIVTVSAVTAIHCSCEWSRASRERTVVDELNEIGEFWIDHLNNSSPDPLAFGVNDHLKISVKDSDGNVVRMTEHHPSWSFVVSYRMRLGTKERGGLNARVLCQAEKIRRVPWTWEGLTELAHEGNGCSSRLLSCRYIRKKK